MAVDLHGDIVKPAAVVLNLGLKSIRAIVFNVGGAKLAAASRAIQTTIRDEWVEQDPDEWWRLGCDCLREVNDFVGRPAPLLTVTASAACLVALDERGASVRRSIMVSDRRAVSQSAALAAMPEFQSVAARDATFTPDPYFLLPKAMWIRDEEPETWSSIRYLMTPADFLAFRLCGIAATDPLNAEKFYHDGNTYPTELLARLGIDAKTLPEVRPVGSLLGIPLSSVTECTGLTRQTAVHVSTYDAICAFWGSGVAELGDVADVSGTVTSVRALIDRPPPSSESRVFSQSMEGMTTCVAGGSNNLGGGLIEWLKQSFYPNEPLAYEQLESDAARSMTTAGGLLFLPYLLGERCPIWDTEARGVLFGLERHHSRGDVSRAVLESAAFSVRHILSVLTEHGASLKRIRVSGGLARISLVNKIKADVTGLPVEVVAEFETTALGAFILAGTGAGIFGSIAEGATLCKVREVILPDAAMTRIYDDWFGVFLETYAALRPMFTRRAEFKAKHFLESVDRLENL